MTRVKICGLRDADNIKAAIDAGAAFVGFVFYPPSPRNITVQQAAALAKQIPPFIKIVGLFVDPADEDLKKTLENTRIDMIQLHGSETPARVRDIKVKFNKPVMKAIRVNTSEDLLDVPEFEDSADWLLFDAKPADTKLPGGTGKTFDWSLLASRKFQKPWMLSGGLNESTVAQALSVLKPSAVDVSSGVETAPGQKDPQKIRRFIEAVKS